MAHLVSYANCFAPSDGMASASTYSVMWPAGVTPTITIELPDEMRIGAVVLREWHMNAGWDVEARSLELSSDGFQATTRNAKASPATTDLAIKAAV